MKLNRKWINEEFVDLSSVSDKEFVEKMTIFGQKVETYEPMDKEIKNVVVGKVVSIDTKVGAAVKDGDQILTIEAMKMNTYIYANKAGTISAINVSVGDGVEEGQVLAVIS